MFPTQCFLNSACTLQVHRLSKYTVPSLQDGWSPLMIATDQGHLDVVNTLICAGADLNQTNKVCS